MFVNAQGDFIQIPQTTELLRKNMTKKCQDSLAGLL